MKFELPELPYSANALEPVISASTISFHYGKHHQAYVNNLNNLIAGSTFENSTLEEIIEKAEGGIFNNGAQVWNHTFYWEGLTQGGSQPEGRLLQKINEAFGSFDEFKKQFADAAARQFGSGWAWLIEESNGTLAITTTSNAGNPLRDGKKPLFTCDVWEHAYYLDFQNRRPDYLQAFWSIVNWSRVAERLG